MDGSRLLGEAQRRVATWLENEPGVQLRSDTSGLAATAVNLVVEVLNGRHVLVLRETGWRLEHDLRCRLGIGKGCPFEGPLRMWLNQRTSDTPTVLGWAGLARGTFGAGMPTHPTPPSVVRTKEVHGASWHGAAPNTQPSEAETNVAEVAAKPTGTGLPAGPESTVIEGDAVDGIWALVVVVAAAVVCMLLGAEVPADGVGTAARRCGAHLDPAAASAITTISA